MIPRVEPEGMLFGKPLHTFPDHALDDIATSHGNVTQQPHTAESRLQITARNLASPAVVASPASHALHNLSERELKCRGRRRPITNKKSRSRQLASRLNRKATCAIRIGSFYCRCARSGDL